MRRRDFMIFFAGAVPAWALAVRAQQKAMPVVGFLSSNAPGTYAPAVAAFRQGLAETGYIEGQNVAIEYRWAEGRYDRLPALAADLVNLGRPMASDLRIPGRSVMRDRSVNQSRKWAGTESSNPFPSSGESANFLYRSLRTLGALDRCAMNAAASLPTVLKSRPSGIETEESWEFRPFCKHGSAYETAVAAIGCLPRQLA